MDIEFREKCLYDMDKWNRYREMRETLIDNAIEFVKHKKRIKLLATLIHLT